MEADEHILVVPEWLLHKGFRMIILFREWDLGLCELKENIMELEMLRIEFCDSGETKSSFPKLPYINHIGDVVEEDPNQKRDPSSTFNLII